jgi:hypothetical protein
MTEAKPELMDFRRTPDGVEITLLKPPLWLRSKKRLITVCIIMAAITLFAAAPPIVLALFGDGPSVTIVFPFVFLFAGILAVGTEINWERQVGVITVTNGTLTVLASPSATPRQWPVRNVASIRPWVYGKVWELRVDPKEGLPYRAFKGRSRVDLEFCTGLLRPAMAAPRPAPVEVVAIASGGECQICGTAMEERVVYCAKCKTPHHEECWMYNGACSTYGCREIRSTRTA